MKNLLGFIASCAGGAGLGGVLWSLHEEGYGLKFKKPSMPFEITKEGDDSLFQKGNESVSVNPSNPANEAVDAESSQEPKVE